MDLTERMELFEKVKCELVHDTHIDNIPNILRYGIKCREDLIKMGIEFDDTLYEDISPGKISLWCNFMSACVPVLKYPHVFLSLNPELVKGQNRHGCYELKLATDIPLSDILAICYNPEDEENPRKEGIMIQGWEEEIIPDKNIHIPIYCARLRKLSPNSCCRYYP